MARWQRIDAAAAPRAEPPLDSRVGPVDAALIALGAILLVVVLTHLRLDDARWYARTGTWLMAIPVLVAAALLGRHRWGVRRVRLTMQLALVASLLVHALFILAAVNLLIFARRAPDAQRVLERPPLDRWDKLPEYSVERSPGGADPRPDYQRPLETPAPEAAAAAARSTPAQQEAPPAELPRPHVAELEPTIAPHAIRRGDVVEAGPPNGEQRLRWRRKTTLSPVEPRRTAAVAPAPPVIEPRPPAADAERKSKVTRRAAAFPVTPPANAVTPVSASRPELFPPAPVRREMAPRLADGRLPLLVRGRWRAALGPDHAEAPSPTPEAAPRWKHPALAARQTKARKQPTPSNPPAELAELGEPARSGGTNSMADLPSRPAAGLRRRDIEQAPDETPLEAAGGRWPALPNTVAALFPIAADQLTVASPRGATDRPAARTDLAALSPSPMGTPGELTSRLEAGPSRRSLVRGVAVEAVAGDGPRELGDRYAIRSDLTRRPSRRESVRVAPRESGLARRGMAESLRGDVSVVIAADSYRRRELRHLGGGELGALPAPGPETEEAIERGLAFLAREQTAAGRWTLACSGEQPSLASDTAATGLSLLAFLGAGYHHREHKYADNLAAGIGFLLEHQKENGDLYLPLDETSNQSVWLYSHSIAALALCEAYGMTQDPSLRQPAQRALDFIVQSQQALRGGWRYRPNYGSDTSVTGWMTLALRSGALANLETPAGTYEGIRHWLDLAQASPDQPHLYCYNPFAPDTPTQRHGRRPSKTMTAVGLLMRLYSGSRRDEEAMIRGAEFLRDNPPSLGGPYDPQRDTYYWYYATQVMLHMGGRYWEDWDRRLRPLLAESQIREGPWAGSWDPYHPTPDRWAAHAGRLYVTTMNLLSLEVYYRLLPLYVDDPG